MNAQNFKAYILNDGLKSTFKRLYGGSTLPKQRYVDCIDALLSNFPVMEEQEISAFSTPGRTEIGGNHTDHQNGCVLAGSIDLDAIAVVAKNESNIIRIQSEGHDLCVVDLSELSPKREEENTSTALVRGLAAKFTELGYKLGGFFAYTTSNVLRGSGLSSSAAFEVLVSSILNDLFCENKLSAVELAQISQYSENVFFGKPCGLMDQTACAVGGVVSIDFENPKTPKVEAISFNLAKYGYKLVITNTGANHSDLTDDYASVPYDMKQIAKFFNKETLRQVDEACLYENIAALRQKFGDRAILRAIHFYNDNARVPLQVEALKSNDISRFFKEVNASGISSGNDLQNVYSSKNPQEQGISLALSLTRHFINEDGACRVHGGGFAGTMQAYIKSEKVSSYVEMMESVFGKSSCYILTIRNDGAIKVK